MKSKALPHPTGGTSLAGTRHLENPSGEETSRYGVPADHPLVSELDDDARSVRRYRLGGPLSRAAETIPACDDYLTAA